MAVAEAGRRAGTRDDPTSKAHGGRQGRKRPRIRARIYFERLRVVRRRLPAREREPLLLRALLARLRDELRLLDELPRAPPVRLFTVRHARSSASSFFTPRLR